MRPVPEIMDYDYETPEGKGRRLAKESLREMREEAIAILKKKNNTHP